MSKILSVDDSSSFRSMISFALSDAGYNVDEASDGQEGLDKAKAEDYNLVITDINMPGIDGISLLKELRSLPKYKHIPIIILTTESSKERKQEAKSAGATGWIVKPFDRDQLLSAVKKVLE